MRRNRTRIWILVGGITVLGLGGGILGRWLSPGFWPWGGPMPSVSTLLSLGSHSQDDPSVLRTSTPSELATIADHSSARLDRHRARYLLALNLAESDPRAALQRLENLERDYPVLAAHILSLRGQLEAKVGNVAEATATWQTLLDSHGDSPVAAEALHALADRDSRYGDRLLEEWPAHPLAVELALSRLEKDPENVSLMRIVARHGLYTFKLPEVLERLTTRHASQLTPEDWAAIGFAYWEKLDYPNAAKAYAKATPTPLNLYRAARSFQIAEQFDTAIAYYQQLIQTFPSAPETGQGLSKLAPLVEERDLRGALPYWDLLYRNFPDRSAAALLSKADNLSLVGSKVSADQARRSVLSQYGSSDAAGSLRWQRAQSQAKAGHWEKAATWASEIQTFNPQSPVAAEAGFWAGRWWQQANQPQKSQAAFEQVLRDHPESYFAWRSAVFLNLPVGDFQSLWRQKPGVSVSLVRSPLPAGSPALQELYQLGQDGAAWRLWQVELQDPVQPTVAEQFTDGVMRMGVGDYLDGIFMLSSLSDRRDPQEREMVTQLRQSSSFWHNFYPVPFGETIATWAESSQVNPLLITALMRQESRFMPGISSGAGAVGLMQVMPDTGDWIAGKLALKTYDLWDPDTNIRLGTWYLNYTHQEWQGHSMLAVASYNAGPGNVADWMERFQVEDADLFVESIPFSETQGYVKSVFENYWNYLRLYNPDISELMSRYSPDHARIAHFPSPARPRASSPPAALVPPKPSPSPTNPSPSPTP